MATITRDTVVVGRGVPDLTAEQFTAILAAGRSPAQVEADRCYQAIKAAGVSIAFASAIFMEESTLGTAGLAPANKNPGNTRTSLTGIGLQVTTVKGLFIRYPSWYEGFRDMVWRLVKPNYVYVLEGRRTIAQIIYRWAPPEDKNDTEGYIRSVVSSMNKWLGEGNSSNTMTAPIKPNITWKGSPNHYNGRDGNLIVAICDHIMVGTMESTDGWFNNPASQVSSTFGVAKDGRIWQWVKLEDAAWANGITEAIDVSVGWLVNAVRTGVNPNNRTISIEHEGNSGDVMPEAQYQATLTLHRWLISLYPAITVDRQHIIGHYQVMSRTKANCPGKGFPWSRLMADLADSNNNYGGINHVTTENQTPVPTPAPPTPEPDVITIQQTGKQIGFGFKSFWQGLNRLGDNYNLVLMGYPISNEFDINFTGDPTKKRTVQLFERTGLVYEAENAAPWDNHFMTVGQLMEAYQYALDNRLLAPGAALTPFSGVEIKMGNLAKWGEVLQSTFESYAKVGLDEGKIKTFDGLLVAMRSGQSYDDYLAATTGK